MQQALDWLARNHEHVVHGLAELVAIPGISTDGEHHAEIDRTAALTCAQMRDAGLHNVDVLRVGHSLPYAYGEWLEAPGKPTVFLYAHHDVQPINSVEQWRSDPWKLTRRDGRLFGRTLPSQERSAGERGLPGGAVYELRAEFRPGLLAALRAADGVSAVSDGSLRLTSGGSPRLTLWRVFRPRPGLPARPDATFDAPPVAVPR